MNHIEIRNVTLPYQAGDRQVIALENLNLDVGTSEFLCILGPSGCGKTTLLNILAGFLTPPIGEVRIGGKRVVKRGQDRGVVFQDFAQLFPWRTARGNVEFGLEIRGVPGAIRRETALKFLRLVKLETFADAYPSQLSGGMQQRVAIARALAYNPAVLLMDEPFAALDAMTRDEMQRLLVEVWQQTRKTVVYVTHNVAEAVYLADRVVVMAPHPGTVMAEIRVAIPRPRDPLGADFVATQKEILRNLGLRGPVPLEESRADARHAG
jgi:NitT/TauT family transport system ATP-binding protein